jgi:PTS system fructose-specific IIC component
VIIAADTQVDKTRFAGKRLHEASTKAAIHDGAALVRKAIAEPRRVAPGGEAAAKLPRSGQAGQGPAGRRSHRFLQALDDRRVLHDAVCGGGRLVDRDQLRLGGINVYDDANKGTLGWTLFQIGAKAGFTLMVPILAGFIAYSIADRPGIAPGMIGGMIASTIGSGFLGGIAAGFLAGYVVKFLSD